MPDLRELLTRQGVSFDNFFVTNSICCPSRATILSGLYTHSHQVYTNADPDGGFRKFYSLGEESSTVATWLQAAGYRTVLLGKYLNGYPLPEERDHIPVGWTEWYSPAKGRPYVGFNYTLNQNGKQIDYGSAPEQYLTDVLSKLAEDFIRRAAHDPAPFFVFLSSYAPHAPARPAPRHQSEFAGLQAPRTPAFNEADVQDKIDSIRFNPIISDEEIESLDETYRNRLQSVQAVDEMIAHLVDVLGQTGQLENTYIIFSSDNGYHIGQHRLPAGKGTPYDEDIHVPFIVRGPGIPPGGLVSDYIAGNVDIAPTIAELAGVIPVDIEGRSLVPLFNGADLPQGQSWRQAFLIEFYGYGEGGAEASNTHLVSFGSADGILEPPDLDEILAGGPLPQYIGLRTKDFLYVEYQHGFRELYDLTQDPYQLENIASSADPGLVSQLSGWLGELAACRGQECLAIESRQIP
jgi:arylsulfatase A-like enzyme